MKTIDISISGNSLLAYVNFFDGEITNRLKEISEGSFDFVDFVSQHEKYSVFLGRGFCMEEEPVIKVIVQGKKIYSGPVYMNTYDYAEPKEMRKEFKDEEGVNYDDVISGINDDECDADVHFFSEANQYAYCSLETVICYKSKSTVTIEVDDDFKLSDLKIKFMDVDTGDKKSITQKIYHTTNLEIQVYGVSYKEEFFEFEGGEDEGGANEIYWFAKNNDGIWESNSSHDLQNTI